MIRLIVKDGHTTITTVTGEAIPWVKEAKLVCRVGEMPEVHLTIIKPMGDVTAKVAKVFMYDPDYSGLNPTKEVSFIQFTDGTKYIVKE